MSASFILKNLISFIFMVIILSHTVEMRILGTTQDPNLNDWIQDIPIQFCDVGEESKGCSMKPSSRIKVKCCNGSLESSASTVVTALNGSSDNHLSTSGDKKDGLPVPNGKKPEDDDEEEDIHDWWGSDELSSEEIVASNNPKEYVIRKDIGVNFYMPIRDAEFNNPGLKMSEKKVYPSFHPEMTEEEFEKYAKSIKIPGTPSYEEFHDAKKFTYNEKELSAHQCEDVFNTGWLDVTLPVVLIIPGNTEDNFSRSVRTLVEAYLKRNDHTVVVVDWFELNTILIKSVYYAHPVSQNVAVCMNQLRTRITGDFQFIGYSIGAQMAALVSTFMEQKAQRITGLDPMEAWTSYGGLRVLSKEHADFVDVIHTDIGRFGVLSPIGHIDFILNGGQRYQPGCTEVNLLNFYHVLRSTCSHSISWRTYAESLYGDPENFVARKCDSYRKFLSGHCNKSDNSNVINFGYPVDKRAVQGEYYAQTRPIFSKLPYGRGIEGATPKPINK